MALYAIAKFKHNIISNSLTYSSRHVNNSFELHRSLSNKTIHKDDILLFLDATSLFTNISLDLAVQSITKRWIDIEKNICIPFKEFISILKFILSSTYFIFNDTFYKQTFWTPIRFPFVSYHCRHCTVRSRKRSVEHHWSGLALLL